MEREYLAMDLDQEVGVLSRRLPIMRNVLAGAGCELWAWLVYGIVEFVLTCTVPALLEPGTTVLGWQWSAIALLFGVYALIGLIVGSGSGALLTWVGRHRDSSFTKAQEIIAVLTITAAFAANLISAWPLHSSERVSLAIAVTLAALFAGALASRPWLESTAFLANPWTVTLLLLIPSYVSREALPQHSKVLKMGVSLAALGLTLALSALWHRERFYRRGRVGRWGVLAGMAILLLGVVLSGITPRVHVGRPAGMKASSVKSNVVLIVMDTVRADHLSVYGYERDTTPHLRDFVRGATIYRRAIATSDWTVPTHASLFTGLYPLWHGADFAPPAYPFGRPIALHCATLAQVLRSNGYSTVAVVANWDNLAPSLGFARGFAAYDRRRPVPLAVPLDEPFYIREAARRLLSLAIDTDAFEALTLRAADINRRAFALLEEARHTGPLFLFLNYMDAHRPYVLQHRFSTRFPGRDRHFKISDFREVAQAVHRGERHLSAAERADLVSQYDGAIACEDEEIGNLLARLRELGLYDDSMIIIVGDHGEGLGEHDLIDHAVGSVYQTHVHVPLLIKYPGQRESHQVDALVSQVDIMPTILDVVACALPTGVQGKSLRFPRTEDSDVVYSYAIAGPLVPSLNRRFRGVRQGIYAGGSELITWSQGSPELYDLAADPGETCNQYRTDDPRTAALADRLSAWAATAPRGLEQHRPLDLDKRSLERLRALGYVQ